MPNSISSAVLSSSEPIGARPLAPNPDVLGYWHGPSSSLCFGAEALGTLLAHTQGLRQSLYVVRDRQSGALGAASAALAPSARSDTAQIAATLSPYEVIAMLPPQYPEWLGDRAFTQIHGVRFAYVAGAMANGIASVEMVQAIAHTGALGIFGAAGLSLTRVKAAIETLRSTLDPLGLAWGVNLIHSPNEPNHENALAQMLIDENIRCVEASAYLALSPAIVRYACTGLRRDAQGQIQRRNRVLAKVSRSEVALPFMRPAPPAILQQLLEAGLLSAEEVSLAALVPLSEDITAEADSGGHTDNRALSALVPSLMHERDRLLQQYPHFPPIRIGAAGGLGTPSAVAAAFAMGAAYVQTGSVNQACVEAGLAASARALLAQAQMTDVIMAPAADMFEMGVNVQVLRRGSLFAVRARKLYELYRSYPSYEAIPAPERQKVEGQILLQPFAEAWESTREFWLQRDPEQVERAQREPKHLMALVFRAYLGRSSRWAIDGLDARQNDYQIWCGPAMGAFNHWVQGSFMQDSAARSVRQVALNLLEGAACIGRAQQLRSMGLAIPARAFDYAPRPLAT